ncbi:MAG: anthranilate synthase component I [Planctomycetes bacterium]|nr:anthranilate synthase component I [Planctomycetota bacterium]
MAHYPDFDAFARLAQTHSAVPVYRRLVSDALTPVSAFHNLDTGGPACLFESVIGGEKVGRYSIVATDPHLQLSASGESLTIRDASGTRTESCADPLRELQDRVERVRAASIADLPPFTGGAIGYAGYDVARYSERLPHPPLDDRRLPDLSFGFFDQLVVFDNVQKTMFVIALAHVGDADSARSAYDAACGRVDRIAERLAARHDGLAPADIAVEGPPRIAYTSNFERTDFEKAVERCVEYIRAGDIFQVVLSQRLAVDLTADPFELYRTLRVVNPSPFMFFLRTRDCTLVGSSPEILCRVVDGRVTVRPLAGTRPRGATPDDDQRLADELLADPKERAEHVMLVDLGRNDVGRVAEYGSVELSDIMVIERYSHVMHITSNVTGRLAQSRTPFDALRACLPAGTVSGAPKVRAMQIIDELEPHRRGPYAGAVGYIDYRGNMDTCIALRTVVVAGGTAYIQAGAGIVADSRPSSEYQETLNKARGLLKAMEITESRSGHASGRHSD